MERFKVLAKTEHIALLQVRFDNELDLRRFCENLPCVKHVDQHDGVTVLSTIDESEKYGAPAQGTALAACLIVPEFHDA